jgi:hypothetical protein
MKIWQQQASKNGCNGETAYPSKPTGNNRKELNCRAAPSTYKK